LARDAIFFLSPARGSVWPRFLRPRSRRYCAGLLDADEMFLCSSLREVMPAASVDGKPCDLGPAAHEL